MKTLYIKKSIIRVVITVILFGSTHLAAEDDFPPNPLEKPGWHLIKNDEFNGDALDTDLWEPYYLRHRTTDERAAARYDFRDGALVLQIHEDTPSYLSDAEWSVSSIQTGERTNLHKDGVRSVPTFEGFLAQYGYYEVRAKHQRGSGHHVAFWFIGFENESWHTGEVDVSEDPGSGVTYTKLGNVVEWSDPNLIRDSGDSFECGADLTAGFHIYAVHWESDRLRFYFDNELKKTVNYAPTYPCCFILGIYQKANWTLPFDESIPYPKEYAIDYFRAYQEGEVTPTLKNLSPASTSGFGLNVPGQLLLTGYEGTLSHSSCAMQKMYVGLNGKVKSGSGSASGFILPFENMKRK